jgi:hypothetical protein
LYTILRDNGVVTFNWGRGGLLRARFACGVQLRESVSIAYPEVVLVHCKQEYSRPTIIFAKRPMVTILID